MSGKVERYLYHLAEDEMKVSKLLVTQFEEDQKTHGTKTALSNVLWMVASDILHDLGVKSVKTAYKKS